MKKVFVIGVIALFIFVGVQPAFATEPVISTDIVKEDNLRDINLGFILCRITYIEIGIWWETGFHGQKVELKDQETGEVVAQGKTGFFGFILFPFLPIGHDYRITAYTECGTNSKKVDDIGLFQKVKIVFITR
jgi:hypothetical protein